jgi:hypothetical protein
MFIRASSNAIGLSFGSRVLRVSRYVGHELAVVLDGQPDVLGRTRLALWETVPPMSLHIAVLRFGFGRAPVLDVLYDTTDSEPNTRAFCHVAYHHLFGDLVAHLTKLGVMDLGVRVNAF